MASESDISVQGHGVHTAFEEMVDSLNKRSDIELIRGEFGRTVDCDIVHLHTIGPSTWRKLFQRGPKKVVSAHVVPASLVGSIILMDKLLPAVRGYMRWYYNRADKVLAVSGTVARILHEDLKVPQEKIETFYNTIDMSQYASDDAKKQAARQKLKMKGDEFVVVGIGQVQPRKRLDMFVRMAKELPDVTFIWIGGIPFKRLGADYTTMQKLIETPPQNLKLPGVIPHDEIKNYLSAADVFCLPAEQENHPMCVLEAAGAGLPIVLRDIPEYDDTFKDDAWRCNDDEFSGAIRTLKDDKKAYAAWKKKADAIAKRFDSGAAAERLVKLYHQLLQ